MASPTELTTVYCTDEDIAVLCYADFDTLAPKDAVLAEGNDGVFLSSDFWTINSASSDFVAQGVQVGHVAQLSGPRGTFRGGGSKFAIGVVTPTSLTLRRVGKPDATGMPPSPSAGVTNCTFRIVTYDAQIQYICYDLNLRFGIDPNFAIIAPLTIYDLRALQLCTVLSVIVNAYTNDTRSKDGDFARKLTVFERRLSDALGRTTIRWNQLGETPPPTSSRWARYGR